MRSGRRSVLTAVTVVCALTVLAAPGTAFANAPLTPSASANSSPIPTPAHPSPPPDKDLEAVRQKLDRLYHDAAVATDDYDAAQERTRKQSAALARLTEQIANGRNRLAELKDRAGAAARAQYRTGIGLPPAARLMLSRDPEQFLDSFGLLLQGQRAGENVIAETARAQRDLKRCAADAAARWKQLEADRKAKDAARKKVERQIAAAEKLQARLEKRQQERLAELEREAARKAQAAWLGTGILKDIKDNASHASQQSRRAVEFATAQLGKPYVWGAEGPDTYDCSGLTSQAWAYAGHPIPRTSQEQWKQLTHVAITDMRPGDLVIYFSDASHVALYVGNGTIIHAPRPGRTVTLAGAGTMPILGVVRPDGERVRDVGHADSLHKQ